MKIFDDLITFIIRLDARRFTLYLGLTLGGFLAVGGGMSYFFYSKSSGLVETIKYFQKLALEAKQTVYTYQTIHERKQAIFDALAHERDFELKSFFEAFCKENNLKPESSWATLTSEIEGNEILEEVSLQATFSKFTMQTLVHFLAALQKKDLIYIKNLRLTKENPNAKTIAVDITIATLKFRQEQEGRAS